MHASVIASFVAGLVDSSYWPSVLDRVIGCTQEVSSGSKTAGLTCVIDSRVHVCTSHTEEVHG